MNKDAEKGKENTAFDHADDSKKNGVESQPSQQQNGTTALETDTGDEKWGSNYVPFGDYPAKGNIVYVKEVCWFTIYYCTFLLYPCTILKLF